jgi:hypothetical protein
MGARRSAFAAALALGALLPAPAAWADEAVLLEQPPADSARAVVGPFQKDLSPRPEKPPLFPKLRSALDDLPPFLRDSHAELHLRTYYFDRLRFDRSENEAWAYGGWLQLQTGWLLDHLSLESAFFTSQKVLGLLSRDGTGLLQPGQKGYSVLGVANAQLRFSDERIVAWRQVLDLPFVNKQDSRMTPNTFEAYTLTGQLGDVKFVGSQVLAMKQRNSEVFRPMSEVAGAEGTDRSMTLLGAGWLPSERFMVGAITEFVYDSFNTVYAEADGEILRDWNGIGLKAELQFTDQRSVGAALLPEGSFETQRWGGRVAASYAYAVLRLGFSTTGAGAGLISPYGTDPSFLSMMQSDFRRAGEDAWMAGLSYEFDRIGLPELSAIFYYVGASGAHTNQGVPLLDRNEMDLTLDYRRQTGRLRGLWLRFRISFLDETGNPRTQREMRVIVNYDLPVI